MFIYLGGCLTYYHRTNQWDKATYWRNELVEFFKDNNIEYFNPVKSFEKEINHTYSNKMIVSQNKYYLDKTDILFMNLDDILQSPGSQYELTYAKECRNIPIITFGDKCWSPHISNCSTQHGNDYKEALEIFVNMFM